MGRESIEKGEKNPCGLGVSERALSAPVKSESLEWVRDRVNGI